MALGTGIFLIAVGAILSFAFTEQQVGALNLWVVGIILMVVGALGIVLEYLWWRPRRTSGTVTEVRRTERY